ncbi:hypothetical protein MKX08_001123 [Trichoderma sp. CBMAI-0020]|nr:hypothetical protein MKX08_001123 [Trichoderma sp. CBMAI-0020]
MPMYETYEKAFDDARLVIGYNSRGLFSFRTIRRWIAVAYRAGPDGEDSARQALAECRVPPQMEWKIIITTGERVC